MVKVGRQEKNKLRENLREEHIEWQLLMFSANLFVEHQWTRSHRCEVYWNWSRMEPCSVPEEGQKERDINNQK